MCELATGPGPGSSVFCPVFFLVSSLIKLPEVLCIFLVSLAKGSLSRFRFLG